MDAKDAHGESSPATRRPIPCAGTCTDCPLTAADERRLARHVADLAAGDADDSTE